MELGFRVRQFLVMGDPPEGAARVPLGSLTGSRGGVGWHHGFIAPTKVDGKGYQTGWLG